MIDGQVGAPFSTGHPLPRAGLLKQPTELQFWARLSEEIGCEIYGKRDDVSELGLGGNKLRKLDLILGQAIRDEIDTIVTVGGLQSNHCRQTAAACARLGLNCIIFLQGPDAGPSAGNVLLDRLFGAEVHIKESEDFGALEQMAQEHASKLEESGFRTLVVPLGGASALGTYSFALGMQELEQQLYGRGILADSIVVAAGTGSTVAGIALGSAMVAGTEVHAVSVSRSKDRLENDIREHARIALPFVGDKQAMSSMEELLSISDGYIGAGYTQPTAEGVQAVRLLAQTEGILADLTYAGKALAFLVDYAKVKRPSDPIVFWHTGGFPELFARQPSILQC